jgi:hypothetical protein
VGSRAASGSWPRFLKQNPAVGILLQQQIGQVLAQARDMILEFHIDAVIEIMETRFRKTVQICVSAGMNGGVRWRFGGYGYGFGHGGMGIVGTVLVIVLILLLLGFDRSHTDSLPHFHRPA